MQIKAPRERGAEAEHRKKGSRNDASQASRVSTRQQAVTTVERFGHRESLPFIGATLSASVASACCAIALAVLAAPAAAGTWSVNTTADDGTGTCGAVHCTLRDAISSASPGDTITFALPAPSTITLVIDELLADKNLTIKGPGAKLLTVERSHAAGTRPFRIFHVLSTVAITGMTLSNGSSPLDGSGYNGSGGAILNEGAAASLLVIDCIISGNHADFGNSGGGGGIANKGGMVTIHGSTISGNAAYGGAGVANDYTGGTVVITSSTISGNTAVNFGGGVDTNGGTVLILNSTISGNVAGEAGGVGLSANTLNFTTLNITSSTIAGNSTYLYGGGGVGTFGATYGKGSTVDVRNSIIAGNTSAGSAPDFNGTLNSQGFNLIGNTGGTVVTGITTGNKLNVDPMLGPLQDNGGPTKTIAPLPGSPVIDAGNVNGTSIDQRGLVRPVDDPTIPNAGGDGTDMGAYEVQADQLPGCSGIDRVVRNGNDSGAGSLRATIANVCAGTTITFAADVVSPITLTSGELLIGRSLSISGAGANRMTVQRSAAPGTPLFRIFDIPGNVSATISGLTIANGQPGSYGAGIYVQTNGTLNLIASTLTGNISNDSGGGLANNGTVVIRDCAIAGNSAVSGGGLYNYEGLLNVVDSTIAQNTASSGAGFYNYSTFAGLVNTTVSGNAAAAAGGGIVNIAGSETRLRNTIVAGNTAAIVGPDLFGALTSQGFNLVGDSSGATLAPVQPGDQIGNAGSPIAPLLGPLQDNGGPTATMALLAGSPAIDRGHASGSTADQRGAARPIDNFGIANATGGDGADIGAFEHAGAALDVDANGGYEARTDGLLIMRYLFGMSDAALTGNATAPNATRSAPADIVRWLNGIRPLLDLDGNGTTDALTDGAIATRYLNGLRGPSLVAGAIGAGATRTTPAQIEAYIQSRALQ